MHSLVDRREKRYFILLLLVSIPMYALFLLSGAGIIILLVFAAISLILHLLSMGYIRSNGVKVTPHQFPHIYESALRISKEMGMNQLPDLYIMQSGGVLNAFAARFFGKPMIVLYSDIVEVIKDRGEEQLNFVIAHELAHHKRNHILKSLLILPGNWVPFLAQAYWRGCEYTCDRMAAHYVHNVQTAQEALAIFAVGKQLYKEVDLTQYQMESSKETNVMVWLSEKLMTHPSLPKRIHALDVFAQKETPVAFKTPVQTKLLFGAMVMAPVIVIAAGVFAFQYFQNTSYYSDFMLESTNTTPLMLAASENDIDKVNELLADGAEVNASDDDGWTPLHYALMFSGEQPDSRIVKLLIKNGANPSAMTKEGDVAMHQIVVTGDADLIHFTMEHGGNLEVKNGHGETPLFAAIYTGYPDIVQILLNEGADANATNASGMTALEVAKDEKLRDIIPVLEKAVPATAQ